MAAKKQKIRITAPGIYGADGMIEVGAELEITGEVPTGWKTKCVVLGKASAKSEPVANAPSS